MKLIYKGRGEGKTTELIKLSVATNTYILVKDKNRQRQVADLAQALGYDSMLFPVTLFEHFEAGRSKGMINRRFLIDDADDILQYLIGVDIPILACSLTKNDAELSVKLFEPKKEVDECPMQSFYEMKQAECNEHNGNCKECNMGCGIEDSEVEE